MLQLRITLLKILHGFRSEKQARAELRSVEGLPCFTLGGKPLAVLASNNYRRLRQKGITVRPTIDCLIATFCVNATDLQAHFKNCAGVKIGMFCHGFITSKSSSLLISASASHT